MSATTFVASYFPLPTSTSVSSIFRYPRTWLISKVPEYRMQIRGQFQRKYETRFVALNSELSTELMLTSTLGDRTGWQVVYRRDEIVDTSSI